MKPREIRLLRCLIDNENVMVKDLRTLIGALNPADIVFTLRKSGWNIQTGYISIRDRDGNICNPGFYWLDENEKERAKNFIKEAERTGGAVLSAKKESIKTLPSKLKEYHRREK